MGLLSKPLLKLIPNLRSLHGRGRLPSNQRSPNLLSAQRPSLLQSVPLDRNAEALAVLFAINVVSKILNK